MKISYNKLKSHIPTLPEVNILVNQVIFYAFEVEDIEKQGDDFMLDIKVLPDRAFDAKTEEGIVKEISVITGAPCDKEKIEQALNKLGGAEHEIKISTEEIEKKLGIAISGEVIAKIFERFWYPFVKEGSVFTVTIPSYRPDLIGTHDLIDEIIRIHGYENLPGEIPKIDFHPKQSEVFSKIIQARSKLLADGYSEVMTYSFTNKGEVQVLASASDKKFLRTNLSDGLKESLKLNQLNASFLGMKEIKIFEIGTVFFKDREEMHVVFGNKKEVKEMKLDEFISQMQEISPLFNATLTRSETSPASAGKFKMWSLFPFITRDIALWAGENTKPEEVIELIKSEMGSLVVRGPELFDQFKKLAPPELGGGVRVSYAFRLVFQSFDKTLTDEEINVYMAKITQKLTEKGFEIR